MIDNMFLLVVTLLLFFSSAVLALDCETPKVAPYYGNGMFNSADVAWNSARALQKEIERKGLAGTRRVVVAYNTNEEALEQLLQVSHQKKQEAGREYFRWLSNLALAPDFFRMLAAELAKQYDKKAYQSDGDLRKQIAQYEADLSKNYVVLVIGHSQGNFYANSSWQLLQNTDKNKGKFSVVSVATPSTYVAGNGPYTTLTQDRVMMAIRDTEGALPANVTNSSASASGHEFVSQYLKGNLSGPKIMEDVTEAARKLTREFSEPTKEGFDFLDESLWPFLRYACLLKSTTEKYTDGECIALAALDRSYWPGVPKQKRSLGALLEWLDDCEKKYWHENGRHDFLQCQPLSSLPSFEPTGNPSGHFMFVDDHPECRWRGEEVGRRANASAVDTARSLLKTTPKIFRLSEK